MAAQLSRTERRPVSESGGRWCRPIPTGALPRALADSPCAPSQRGMRAQYFDAAMPQDSIEVVRLAHDAFNRRDVERLVSLSDRTACGCRSAAAGGNPIPGA